MLSEPHTIGLADVMRQPDEWLTNDINNDPGTSCCDTVQSASMSVMLPSVPKFQLRMSMLEMCLGNAAFWSPVNLIFTV